jgi:hypothetical protein
VVAFDHRRRRVAEISPHDQQKSYGHMPSGYKATPNWSLDILMLTGSQGWPQGNSLPKTTSRQQLSWADYSLVAARSGPSNETVRKKEEEAATGQKAVCRGTCPVL